MQFCKRKAFVFCKNVLFGGILPTDAGLFKVKKKKLRDQACSFLYNRCIDWKISIFTLLTKFVAVIQILHNSSFTGWLNSALWFSLRRSRAQDPRSERETDEWRESWVFKAKLCWRGGTAQVHEWSLKLTFFYILILKSSLITNCNLLETFKLPWQLYT